MNVGALLDGLDVDQHRAVTCEPTATIVHAGAGSGKTRVLTHRIAWRVAQGNADPARVLAITFTREAAAEMRRRLRALGVTRHDRAGDGDQPTIGTFHSVALALLRRRASDTSATVPHIVGNRISLLNQALGEDSLGRHAAAVLAEIDWAHARLVTPDRYAREIERLGRRIPVDAQRVAIAFGAYERLKVKRGLADLDDLITLATRTLHDRQDFAAATRFRFRHLFVDEAQDMNPLQFSFLEALRGGRDDVFIVGDPLQSIYGWNGADSSIFRGLPEVFNRPTVLTLPNNYRCTPQVLEVARHVALHDGTPPVVQSRRTSGLPVELIEIDDEIDESLVVGRVVQRHMRSGVEPSIAVLARTHTLLEPIAAALTGAGVPVVSRRASTARTNAIDDVADCPSRHDLAVWAADVIVESTDDDERMVAEQLQAYLRETNGTTDGRSAAAHLRAIQGSPDRYGVELLTFHSAKGREFAVVIVVGAEAGLLPHSSATSPEQHREEARLAYVACTRAADQLFIVRARRRKGRTTTLSPFFAELPEGVVHRSGTTEVAASPVLARLSPGTDPRTMADNDLRRRIRALRDSIARANFTLPEAVLSDAEISRIVNERPADTDALSGILGPLTARRIGAALLRELQGSA